MKKMGRFGNGARVRVSIFFRNTRLNWRALRNVLRFRIRESGTVEEMTRQSMCSREP